MVRWYSPHSKLITKKCSRTASMDTKDAGRMGGSKTSKKKAAAARRNGKKGGRPTTITCHKCSSKKQIKKYDRKDPDIWCYCTPDTPTQRSLPMGRTERRISSFFTRVANKMH